MSLYVRKVAHLQVTVVVKAVWGIFNNTNGFIYKLFTSHSTIAFMKDIINDNEDIIIAHGY